VKTTSKRLILISITAVIILLTSYILILNWDNFFAQELQQPSRALILELEEDIKSFKMKRILRENRGLILRKENFTQISNYQKYVTPNDPIVTSYKDSNNINTNQKAYASAVQWIWVSDQRLHGQLELWLMPSQFIQDTPSDPDNPVPGSMVSDCESQAYTLVSILESIGVSKNNIRVVIGEVNFSGETGGHAWVQLYQDNQWFELEATSGPFYDEDDQKLVNNTGFPYNYFKTHPYPVVEYWAFFNDIYYYNPNTEVKSPDLPLHWLTT
jgi:hypothetical protein